MMELVLTMANIWLFGCVFIGAFVQFAEPDVSVQAADAAAAGAGAEDPQIPHGGPSGGATPEGDDYILDIYGLPGFQHEFKMEIAAGGSECFFQMLRQPAKLHVAFEVLRGADRNIDVRIRDSAKNVIGNFEWTNEGNFEHNVTIPGIYQFCIDNSLSRFSSKLVYLYLLSFNEVDWNRYVDGYQDFFGGVDNVSKSLEKFDQYINKVLVLQATGRRHLAADWYMIRSNNTYVQRLSIAMCVVILLASISQVMFVRRLFKAPPKVKPRA